MYSRVGTIRALLVVWALTGIPAVGADPPVRLALVFGNSRYFAEWGNLPGAERDAALVAQALSGVGFDVQTVPDGTAEVMRQSLRQFIQQLAAYEGNAIGFVYYAGHGAVGRRHGDVYLLPVDATRANAFGSSLWMPEVLDAFEHSQVDGVIVVIDACRTALEMPDFQLVDASQLSAAERARPPEMFGRRVRGLGELTNGQSLPQRTLPMLVAYAAAPGRPAADDGLFARTMTDAMRRPGATSETVFEETRRAVSYATNREQLPRVDNGLDSTIVFTPSREDLIRDLGSLISSVDWSDRDARAEGLGRLRDIVRTGDVDVQASAENYACDPSVPLLVRRELKELGHECPH